MNLTKYTVETTVGYCTIASTGGLLAIANGRNGKLARDSWLAHTFWSIPMAITAKNVEVVMDSQ